MEHELPWPHDGVQMRSGAVAGRQEFCGGAEQAAGERQERPADGREGDPERRIGAGH